MKQTESGLRLFAQCSRGSLSTPWPKARGEGVERTADPELKASVEEFSSPTEVNLILLPLSHLLAPQSETTGLGRPLLWSIQVSVLGHRAGGGGRRVALQEGTQHGQGRGRGDV